MVEYNPKISRKYYNHRFSRQIIHPKNHKTVAPENSSFLPTSHGITIKKAVRYLPLATGKAHRHEAASPVAVMRLALRCPLLPPRLPPFGSPEPAMSRMAASAAP